MLTSSTTLTVNRSHISEEKVVSVDYVHDGGVLTLIENNPVPLFGC